MAVHADFISLPRPLPLRKDFPRAGGRCRAATKRGVWICEAKTERASPAEFYRAAIQISDIKQELDDIAIVHNVLFALGALQTLGLDGGVVEVVGFQIVIADDAGADEAALEVAVDLTGSLRSLGALADGPCAALLLDRKSVV